MGFTIGQNSNPFSWLVEIIGWRKASLFDCIERKEIWKTLNVVYVMLRFMLICFKISFILIMSQCKIFMSSHIFLVYCWQIINTYNELQVPIHMFIFVSMQLLVIGICNFWVFCKIFIMYAKIFFLVCKIKILKNFKIKFSDIFIWLLFMLLFWHLRWGRPKFLNKKRCGKMTFQEAKI